MKAPFSLYLAVFAVNRLPVVVAEIGQVHRLLVVELPQPGLHQASSSWTSSERACGLLSFSVMSSPFRRAPALQLGKCLGASGGGRLLTVLHILCRCLHGNPERRRLPATLVVDEAKPPPQLRRQAPELLHPDQDRHAGMARQPRFD